MILLVLGLIVGSIIGAIRMAIAVRYRYRLARLGRVIVMDVHRD